MRGVGSTSNIDSGYPVPAVGDDGTGAGAREGDRGEVGGSEGGEERVGSGEGGEEGGGDNGEGGGVEGEGGRVDGGAIGDNDEGGSRGHGEGHWGWR